MKYCLILILGSLLSCNHNQSSSDYLDSYDWMVKIFEENDAAFRIVIDEKGIHNYKKFTSQIRDRIRHANDERECLKLMQDWLNYFRSSHIGIRLIKDDNEKSKKSNKLIKPNQTLIHLSKSTLYLKIPSFKYDVKEDIDLLIIMNYKLLKSTPNLIIDIRDNPGGSDASFTKLIPFLYTNPIRFTGCEFLASELSAKAFEEHTKIFNDSLYFMGIANKMRNNKGKYIALTDSILIDKRDSIYRFPEKIGIITNKKSASAAETFLMVARQSQKVKIFGEPTKGAFDFSNCNSVKSPDGKFLLTYAMSRNYQYPEYPIDNIGIQPDFYLDSSIKDWINYTKEILEN